MGNADHCKHVVDDYYIPAFNFLRHEIDPHLLCSLVGLCKSQPSLPAAPVQQTALVPATKLTASSSQCEICQFAATDLFSILEDPYDQRMVKNALESICYRLPNVVDRRCEQFVEGYTAKILDLITSGLGPDQLCLALNICSETKEVAPVELEDQKWEEPTALFVKLWSPASIQASRTRPTRRRSSKLLTSFATACPPLSTKSASS